MAATYPTTQRTYSVKAPGTKINAEYINSLQEEIEALETQLIASGVNIATPTPTANAVPKADAAGKLAVGWMAQPQFYPLITPLSSGAWEGVTKTSANNGVIDLSTVFGAPAGIKAALVWLQHSAGAGGSAFMGAESNYGFQSINSVTGIKSPVLGVVPCDVNGDLNITFVGDFNALVWLSIFGYWL